MTATKNTEAAAATAAKEAALVQSNDGKEYIAPKGHNPNKDWTYIADKDPLETHVLYADMVTRLSGIEVSAKQMQAMLLMHRWMQQSDLNRARDTFKGRTLASVLKGNETLFERTSQRALLEGEDAPVVDSVNEVVGDVAEEIQATLEAAKAPKVEEAPAEEPKAEEAPKPARRARKPRTVAKTEA